jgi:hypothetical protein
MPDRMLANITEELANFFTYNNKGDPLYKGPGFSCPVAPAVSMSPNKFPYSINLHLVVKICFRKRHYVSMQPRQTQSIGLNSNAGPSFAYAIRTGGDFSFWALSQFKMQDPKPRAIGNENSRKRMFFTPR